MSINKFTWAPYSPSGLGSHGPLAYSAITGIHVYLYTLTSDKLHSYRHKNCCICYIMHSYTYSRKI